MNKKVTTVLQGGLGNQMFQIAAAYSYSISNNADFKIYEDLYIPCHHPNLELYKDNIYSNLKFEKCDSSFIRYNERSFCFNEIPKINDNVALYGYFQSEKYFSEHAKQIKNLFDFKSDIISKYNNKLKTKNCSIHIRRGDYLNLQHCHPNQTLEYYKKAVSLFDDDTLFFVFSNDIDWCKKEINKNSIGANNLVFIDGNSCQEDLLLMSKCQNNIIANSSFSWWASWLNNNELKKIIYPKNWFTESYAQRICGNDFKNYKKSLIPEGWIEI